MYKKNILRLKKAVYYFLKELKSDPYKLPYMGDKYYCPVCKTNLEYFNTIGNDYLSKWDKYQCIYSIFSFETINILKYSCPKCYANDRDRLYALYFEKQIINNKININRQYNTLEIAPSPFSRYLKQLSFINYRSADLYMEGVDDKVDITNMNIYEDNKYDIFICSHVLEHVKEDKKAIHELYRILKKNGWGIAMVPITSSIEDTQEDDSIVTDADRWKYFGQDDHVRMYSKKGFISSLQEGGFKVKQFDINYFGAEQFEKNGIHPRSVLYIVEKI